MYSDIRDSLRAFSAVNPDIAGLYQLAERQYAAANKRATQPAQGCDVKYTVPQLEVGSVGVTGRGVAVPSGSASNASRTQDINSIFQDIPLGPPGRTLSQPLINGGALGVGTVGLTEPALGVPPGSAAPDASPSDNIKLIFRGIPLDAPDRALRTGR